MPTLYVTEPGARLEKEYRRLVVAKGDAVLLAVPLSRVDHVVLVGNVGMTTPAMHALLDAEIGVSLLNSWGDLKGHLRPEMGKNLDLRRQQYQRGADADFCLGVSRALVMGKLRNTRNLARRQCRDRVAVDKRPIAQIDAALAACAGASNLATLRGIEGNGSSAWFAMLRQIIEEPWHFARRTRRPPNDPVNAMLSLGYTLLSENMMTACEIVGLDPYEGYFHADKYGRPALALDLMEEFRAIIVDSVMLRLVNRDMIDPAAFRPGPEGGIYLEPAGMRIFFQAYSKRLQTTVKQRGYKRAISYQKWFEVQARKLRKVIEDETAAYEAFLVR